MKLTIVEKNLLSWTAMHIDFVMCNNHLNDSLYYHFIHCLEGKGYKSIAQHFYVYCKVFFKKFGARQMCFHAHETNLIN